MLCNPAWLDDEIKELLLEVETFGSPLAKEIIQELEDLRSKYEALDLDVPSAKC
jgi:hypothetical protein